MNKEGLNPEELAMDNEADMTEEQEREVFEQAERMLEDGEGPETKEAKGKTSNNLSGSQHKRRVKCKLLQEKQMIKGFDIVGKKVIPIPKEGQTEQEMELLITGFKLPRKRPAEAFDKPHGSEKIPTPALKRTRTPDTPSTTEKRSTSSKRSRQNQEDLEIPGEFEIIITYADNHTERIALDAYLTVCNELAKHIRTLMQADFPPVFQSKGMRKTTDGRILVRTQDLISMEIIMKATQGIKWTGQSGEKEFLAWISSEAPDAPYQGPWKKYRIHIPGPKADFDEIRNTFGTQNPELYLQVKKWRSYTYQTRAEEEGNFNESHLLVIGLDEESANTLQKKGHKLHYNLWHISFKEWIEDGPKPATEKSDDP